MSAEGGGVDAGGERDGWGLIGTNVEGSGEIPVSFRRYVEADDDSATG